MTSIALPPWLDRQAYPFEPRSFELPEGRMSYVDEGPEDAEPVLFVHGNPSWSFMYRCQIRDLRSGYRCLAPDHLGFGLSDKPPGASYRPQDHSARLARWGDAMELQRVHLVVHDWGGPIGLAWALDRPERIKSLTILNTWMWSVADEPVASRFSRWMGSFPAQFAIRRFDFFVRVLMPRTFPDRAKFDAVASQYRGPFQRAADREGVAAFPKQILGASDWLAGLWERREALADKPTQIVWAFKDPAFRKVALERWQELFPAAPLHKVPDAGHYVAEEMGQQLSPLLEAHFAKVQGN